VYISRGDFSKIGLNRVNLLGYFVHISGLENPKLLGLSSYFFLEILGPNSLPIPWKLVYKSILDSLHLKRSSQIVNTFSTLRLLILLFQRAFPRVSFSAGLLFFQE